MKNFLIGSLVFIILLFAFLYRPSVSLGKLKAKYEKPTSNYLEIDGMQAHYTVEGEGVPLLLIHGTSSSLHTWDKWVPILAEHFKVYAIDMPGGGLTGPHPNDDYSSAAYIDYLDRFCQQLGLDSIYLAGNSLGGKIAWKYAKSNPRVKKLILVDPSGFYDEDRKTPLVFKLGKQKWLSGIVENLNVKPFVNKSLKEVFYDEKKITPELKDRYYDMMSRKGNRKAFFSKVASIEESDTSELKEISCPTLIQWGMYDNWLSYTLGEIYVTYIENSEFVLYHSTGHVPQEESPVISASDVIEFLLKEEAEDPI